MALKKYIDVSNHQGNIDWEKVKAAGVDGVMIRAGYGRNNIDKQFVRNITECNRLGIPCGVYWFSYAYTVELAQKEAQYCLAAIKPYKVELPVCYDFEYDSVRYGRENGVTVNKRLATAFVHAFCGAIEDAGYYAMNYSNLDYLKNYFDDTVLQYDLWLAWYSDAVKPTRDCGMWQYSSKGSVNGISGNVDMNIAYRDYKSIIAKADLNNLRPKLWYEDAQEWVKANGISDGTKPDEPVTRAEVWAMLYRALNK